MSAGKLLWCADPTPSAVTSLELSTVGAPLALCSPAMERRAPVSFNCACIDSWRVGMSPCSKRPLLHMQMFQMLPEGIHNRIQQVRFIRLTQSAVTRCHLNKNHLLLKPNKTEGPDCDDAARFVV